MRPDDLEVCCLELRDSSKVGELAKTHVRHATKLGTLCRNFVAKQSCLSDLASFPTFDESCN